MRGQSNEFLSGAAHARTPITIAPDYAVGSLLEESHFARADEHAITAVT